MMERKLVAVDGESLWDMEFAARRFCIRGLLPQGLCVLGGAPKIGKSWLVLDWCIRIARGDPVWGMEVSQGTTLYLCLEDTLQRVQHRVYCMSEEGTPNAYFATAVGTLADDLESQISFFLLLHPDTVLIVVDTFQMVRGNANEPSYGGDYQDMQKLKRIADTHNITVLLVHHLRKQGDRDPVNRLSGTTGISGAVDAVFVLDRKERAQNAALLVCTGRDVEYRELELRFSKERYAWDLVSDSAEKPEQLLPKEMNLFLEYMKEVKSFTGGNTELTEAFNSHSGSTLEPKKLKQLILGGTVGAGVRAVAALGRLTEGDDSDDPEEQKRKQEARQAASNAGAILGLAIGAMEAFSQNNQSLTRTTDEEQTIEEEEGFKEFLAGLDEEYGYEEAQQQTM